MKAATSASARDATASVPNEWPRYRTTSAMRLSPAASRSQRVSPPPNGPRTGMPLQLSRLRRRQPHASSPKPARGAHIEFLDCSPVPMGALRTDRAAFTHVALAFAFGRAASFALRQATDEDRALLRKHFPALLRSFEKNHGAICRSYFARSV